MNIKYSYKILHASLKQDAKNLEIKIDADIFNRKIDDFPATSDNLLFLLNDYLKTNERIIKIDVTQAIDPKQNKRISIQTIVELKTMVETII